MEVVRDLDKDGVVRYMSKDQMTGVLRQDQLMGPEWKDQLVWDLSKDHTAKKKCRKLEANIPRKGISGPQSQFPHSCV
jgi:hypothetical protein